MKSPGPDNAAKVLAVGLSLCATFMSMDVFADNEAYWDVTKYWNRGGGESVNVMLICDGIPSVPGVAIPGIPTHLTATGWEDGNTSCIVVEDEPDGTFEEYSVDCSVGDVISDTTYICDIANSEAFATFSVSNQFMDGNNITPVTFHINCTNSDPSELQETVIPDTGESIYEATFEVPQLTPGVTDCTVYAERVSGYTATYECGSNNNPDQICINGDPSPLDGFGDESCYFEDIDSSGAYDSINFCAIRNYPNRTKKAVPILNPYSTTMLILLMMGVGIAGFRRFG